MGHGPLRNLAEVRSPLAPEARRAEALQKRCLSISTGTGPIAAGELSRQFVRCFAAPQRAGEVVDSSLRVRLFAVRGPFEHSRKEI